MSFRVRLDKKLKRKEKAYETEQLIKEKRSEEYEVLEEVFDRPTLMTIYELMNKGEIGDIHGVVKAGKEARLYWGRAPNGEELAIKIYLTISSEFKKGMLPYILGDPRFRNIRKDSRSLVYAWAQKEFRNLQLAHNVGVKVPKPFTVKKNVLLMEFIGREGISAPLLKNVELKNPERTFKQIMTYVKKLFMKAKLVHGDLSEYNIMIWKGKPVIFDFSQAVLVEHPNSTQFLLRDLENLHRYFKKLGVKVPSIEEMSRRITSGRI